MAEPSTYILVPNQAVRDELQALSERLPWAPARRLTFLMTGSDGARAASELRERVGIAPIGVIARDESAVLSALSSGADEAAVLPHIDATVLAAFVDRTLLRAQLRVSGRRANENLAHAEKLTALGTLVAGVAHEINNPLTALMLTLDFAEARILPVLSMLDGLHSEPTQVRRLGLRSEQTTLNGEATDTDDIRRMLRDLSMASESIASIVRDLRVFARADDADPPSLVHVPELLDHAVRLVGREAMHTGLIESDYADTLPQVLVARGPLLQVLMNVLINASHAIREVARPLHRIRVSARADDECLAISVSDTGPGIPAETVTRVFDPFFSTKRSDLGTGLGLSISRSIMRRLGGDLSVESVFGDGATFMFFLPLSSEPRTLDVPRRALMGVVQRPGALIVSHDVRSLTAWARTLSAGHRVVTAQETAEAIVLLQSGVAAELLLIDVSQPDAHGLELVSWLETARPELLDHTVFVADEWNPADPLTRAITKHAPLMRKPARSEDLIALVDAHKRSA